MRHKTSVWASGGPAEGRRLAGEELLGRCTAKQSNYFRLYLHSGKLALAEMYFRRVRVVGRSSAAAVALAVILPGEGTQADRTNVFLDQQLILKNPPIV